jgi:hypothetical protein
MEQEGLDQAYKDRPELKNQRILDFNFENFETK